MICLPVTCIRPTPSSSSPSPTTKPGEHQFRRAARSQGRRHDPLQGVNFHVSELTDSKAGVSFSLKAGRQAYIDNFEGTVHIDGVAILGERDPLEIVGPSKLTFSRADANAHFIIIGMAATELRQ